MLTMLLVLFSYWLFRQCGAMHANLMMLVLIHVSRSKRGDLYGDDVDLIGARYTTKMVGQWFQCTKGSGGDDKQRQ